MDPISKNKGFTLIELILYVALSSMILVSSSLFLREILSARLKSQTMLEVEQQGLAVLKIFQNTLMNAQEISSPAPQIQGNELSLNMKDDHPSPTKFFLSDNQLLMQEGQGKSVVLTNSRIKVGALLIKNLSLPIAHPIISVELTLNYSNPYNLPEFDYEKTLYSSFTLRTT